ncbi:MAG: sterol desaturase family protein [Magnetovibrio sp.]|nr:sterol desaturase family protein [Magnetovibrio sp.]
MIDPNALLEIEPQLRLGAFIFIFGLMASLEFVRPRRPLSISKKLRWSSNIGLVFTYTILARLVLPMAPVMFAGFCAQQNWGGLNGVAWPNWIEMIVAITIMDFTIWGQHILAHKLPWFWRLHLVHHSDQDYDVTTGARFHPFEIIISLGIKFGIIAITGASPIAVLLFEITLNGMAIFNHANVRLPLALDRILRRVVVTPDFHRVHHSVIVKETNSNYGFFLSIWDLTFGTYVAQPARGHEDMEIGLDIFRGTTEQRLDKMLTQPFRPGIKSGIKPGTEPGKE